MAGTPLATPDQDIGTDADSTTDLDTPWSVILWNDPINSMELVTLALKAVLGYDQARSENLMFEAHTKGKVAVLTGAYERAEQAAFALHGWKLNATLEKAS